MSEVDLREHYEKKYSHEAASGAMESVERTKTPRNRYEALIEYLPRYFAGGAIMELAAGDGRVAKTLLASDLPISAYTASEISRRRLEGMKTRLSDPRLRIVEMDAERIPMEEQGKYDAVIMLALIEHLVDPIRAMQGIRTFLKPCGFVYIDTPNIAKYTRRIKLALGRFPSTASKNEGLIAYSGDAADLYDEGHLHYFTYRSLSSMLTERCGFSRIEKLGYPVGPMPLGKALHHRLAQYWPEMFSELALVAFV